MHFLTPSPSLYSLALLATSQGNEGTAQQHPPPPPALARRNLSSSMRASALLGVLGLVVVLLRKGRVSKARLLELLAASLGGLLSSSCCTIQLVLNSVSVGCAGFAVLDRFRPFFLFFTFSSLAYKTAMYDVRLHHKPWRSLSTWIVALVLATSPAVVRRLNRGGSGGLVAGAAGQPPLLLLQYKVVGMKCEACANGLKNALEALDTDVHADVLFEEGVVFVEKKSMAADAALELGIAGVFEERGYTSEKVQQRNCEA